MLRRRLPFVTVAAATLVAGCATHRLDGGIFHSSKGYRVTVPGAGWTIVSDADSDLELRDAEGLAGILVHADCDARRAQRPLALLERRLLHGLTQRTTVERGAAPVNGRPAAHSVLEAANSHAGSRMRIETFVVSDGRCVYDLIYAAEPARFATGRGDFVRLVESFAAE